MKKKKTNAEMKISKVKDGKSNKEKKFNKFYVKHVNSFKSWID